jgi:hypothetical protein
MKLNKTAEEHLRVAIKKAIPALTQYKKDLEENEGGKTPSSLLYEQVVSALINFEKIRKEIMYIDNRELNINGKIQGKLWS